MDAPLLIQAIVLLATLLWCHAAILLWDWIQTLRAALHSDKVGHVVSLLGAMVPVVVTYMGIVFAGAVLGLPSVVALLALIVPGGLIVGFRLELRDETPSTPALEKRRALWTLGLALPIIAARALGF